MADEKSQGITRRGFLAGGLAVAVSSALPGCSGNLGDEDKARLAESGERIEAEVLEEVYENSLSPVSEKHIDGLVSRAYSNETVRVNSKYTLKVRREDNGKIMAISVVDRGNGGKEAIDRLIKKGSKISFPKGNLYECRCGKQLGAHLHRDSRKTYISDDTQVALKGYDEIKVLD